MAYIRPFHRLVIIGTMYNEIFNTTVAFGGISTDPGEVTDALLEDVAAAVATWWPKTSGAAGGIGISGSALLTSIKLNRINTSGHYQDGETKQWIYPAPIAGPGFTGVPPQLSLVASLRGVNPRAHAGKGRMYFPNSSAVQGALDTTTGQLGTTVCTQHATGVMNLLMSINAAYVTNGVTAVAGIASNVGGGAWQPLTAIRVGRVIDTMRSRRNKLVEAPVEVLVP